MYQIYFYIKGDTKDSSGTKNTQEFTLLGQAEEEFTRLLSSMTRTNRFYVALIDPSGTTVQEASG